MIIKKNKLILYLFVAGLLSCYEPERKIMETKSPTNRQLISVMEKYKTTLNGLLQDYTIHTNDWSHIICVNKFWLSFMTKVYDAFISVSEYESAKDVIAKY